MACSSYQPDISASSTVNGGIELSLGAKNESPRNRLDSVGKRHSCWFLAHDEIWASCICRRNLERLPDQ